MARIAEIVYPLALDRSFDYEVPEALADRVLPGSRTLASFGPKRAMLGVALSVRDGEVRRKLKDVEGVLDPEPLLSAEGLSLVRWLAERTCAGLGESLKLVVPSAILGRKKLFEEAPAPSAPAPAAPSPAAARFELTAGQSDAVGRIGASIGERKRSVHLLFGVPASGKTEVYLRLIRRAVAQGGQALFLVPEITLTLPFFDEFSASLPGGPGSVALWHSQLSEKERRSAWLGLRSGKVRVVVGARSASLLPFRDLRLAVIDEEQDESYKQDGQSPFYHARDVTLRRAAAFGAVVVLGSATPSVDTFARARGGEYGLIEMPQRVSAGTRAPCVRILDRSSIPTRCITPGLLEAVRARLERREQVILLVNRRGFSNFVVCRRCAWVARCPVCEVAFIHHHPGQTGPAYLLCHHCGRRAAAPASCGRCGKGPIQFAGAGTQRVVSEIKSLLPGVRVLRLDRDTAASPSSEDFGAYRRFRDGEADILVGTKLVAKGFHFPRVTLVGIVDADTMLQMPDFRSAERTVQLLVQAAGRAGRAEMPGEVLLQTSQPTHYAIQAAARGDYSGFSLQELGHRKTFRYPPASTLVNVAFIAKTEEAARRAADAAARQLRAGLQGASVPAAGRSAAGAAREEQGPRAVPGQFAFFESEAGVGDAPASSPAAAMPSSALEEVLGPAPSVHLRLHGRFRYHLLLKLDAGRLDEGLRAVRALRASSSVRVKVNVDPYDLM